MNTIVSQIKEEVIKIFQKEEVELIECKTSYLRGRLAVRCLADYPQGGITLDKCGKINRVISSKIHNSFSGLDYVVEVNSPGLERPLKSKRDFLKVKGRELLLWFKEPVAGKKFIEAKLEKIEEGKMTLNFKGRNISVDFNKVKLGKQKFRT